MKTGVMFEDNSELDKRLAVCFIAETWCNYPKPFSELNFDEQEELEAQGIDEWDYNHREITLDMLPLSAQIRLKQLGYTEEQFKTCKHLIAKAKRWALETGLPYNYVMDATELGQWEMLLAFTQVVAN